MDNKLSDETARELYGLKLLETIRKDAWTITRVPGGWIFSAYYDGGSSATDIGVFVPFDNEFVYGGRGWRASKAKAELEGKQNGQ